MNDEVCIYCEAESVDGDLTGWAEEEFGWKCPECRVERAGDQQPGNGTAGVNGLTQLLDVKQEGEAQGVEFAQQQNYGLMGGSTDWEVPAAKKETP